jgi:hypothetical protein
MASMQLTDLQFDERLALVALSRAVARADGVVSPSEGRTIARIALELGEATYRDLFGRAVESFPDEAALERFLASIQRQEGAGLVFQTILELAAVDEISADEAPLLAWLEEAWSI